MTPRDLKRLKQIAGVQLRLADAEILKTGHKINALRIKIEAITVSLRGGAVKAGDPSAAVDMADLKTASVYQDAMRATALRLNREIDQLHIYLNQARRRRAMAAARQDIIRGTLQAEISKRAIVRQNAQSEQVLDLARLAKANH